MSRVKGILKNEYVKSLLFLVIILGCVGAFWFGLRAYLRTDYPLFVVASGSMIPTLYRGDLIVVQGGLNVSGIIAAYETGDIIVFRKPNSPQELIVHRAVEKRQNDNTHFLITKGDNNNGPDPWEVDDNDLVGKVVWSIPYLGHIPLFVHTPAGTTIIIILIVILILLEFAIPFAKEKEKQEQPEKDSEILGEDSPKKV